MTGPCPPRPTSPEQTPPLLAIRGLGVRLDTAARPLLADLSLELGRGEVVGLCGPSGAGKSTLLHVVAGLVPWLRPATTRGEIRLGGDDLGDLDPAQRAHLLGTCLDRPAAQLFLATPRDELAAARRLHGSTPLLEGTVERLGLGPLLDRRTTTLSSGEAQRVALAVALAAAPRPVLLDEPGVHLDAGGVEALSAALADVARAGGAVVLAEQAGWRFRDAVGRWLRVSRRGLAACPPPTPPLLPERPPPPRDRPVLVTRRLAVARDGRRLVEDVNLELHEGEVVLLTGPNGAGKSTLARVLGGFEAPAAGVVARPAGRVALMLPNAELQLLETTVEAELARLGLDSGAVARLLRRHDLDRLAARAPWTLSRGERQRLVHASLDALQPAVLLVDEPGQGLDPEHLAQLAHLIRRRAERGRAYLVVSHREELAAMAHRWLELGDGVLTERALPGLEGSR